MKALTGSHTRFVASAAAIVVLLLFLTTGVIASEPKDPADQKGQLSSTESIAPAALLSARGGSVTGLQFASGNDAYVTTSTTFIDLPGATSFVYVPTGENALLVARFSAETACYNTSTTTANSGWCSARILLDNTTELNPASGLDFALDSPNSGRDLGTSWEGHAMQRAIVVGPGNHTVKIQIAAVGANTFRVDDWLLTVDRSQKVP